MSTIAASLFFKLIFITVNFCSCSLDTRWVVSEASPFGHPIALTVLTYKPTTVKRK